MSLLVENSPIVPKKERSRTTAKITGSFCSVMFHSLSSTKWKGLMQKNVVLILSTLLHISLWILQNTALEIGKQYLHLYMYCINRPNQLKNNTEGST